MLTNLSQTLWILAKQDETISKLFYGDRKASEMPKSKPTTAERSEKMLRNVKYLWKYETIGYWREIINSCRYQR